MDLVEASGVLIPTVPTTKFLPVFLTFLAFPVSPASPASLEPLPPGRVAVSKPSVSLDKLYYLSIPDPLLSKLNSDGGGNRRAFFCFFKEARFSEGIRVFREDLEVLVFSIYFNITIRV